MNYVAIIKSRLTGEVVQIPLSCKEYHANKLQYVFGRTLCNCDAIVLPSDRFFTDEEIDSKTRTENSLNYAFGKPFVLRKLSNG